MSIKHPEGWYAEAAENTVTWKKSTWITMPASIGTRIPAITGISVSAATPDIEQMFKEGVLYSNTRTGEVALQYDGNYYDVKNDWRRFDQFIMPSDWKPIGNLKSLVELVGSKIEKK